MIGNEIAIPKRLTTFFVVPSVKEFGTVCPTA
jgi:hypothetical protein